jgi:hypothetical protein
MRTLTLTLPRVAYEQQLVALFGRIPAPGALDEMIVDMQRVEFYIPGAITGLMAQAMAHHSAGCRVMLTNFESSKAFGYLQRIDFFKRLGIETQGVFHRHNADGRFVPVHQISFSTETTICTDLTRCVSGTADPTGDAFRLVEYALGEVVSNCKQHSGAVGFASAQYFPRTELARIAVGDSGKGIRDSFRVNGSPHYREGMDDREGIVLALGSEISSVTHLRSPYHSISNRGLGLSIIRELVAQTFGYLVIISGSGWYLQDGAREGQSGLLAEGGFYQGTLVAAGFPRGQIADYTAMHNEALRCLGLQVEVPSSIRFS